MIRICLDREQRISVIWRKKQVDVISKRKRQSPWNIEQTEVAQMQWHRSIIMEDPISGKGKWQTDDITGNSKVLEHSLLQRKLQWSIPQKTTISNIPALDSAVPSLATAVEQFQSNNPLTIYIWTQSEGMLQDPRMHLRTLSAPITGPLATEIIPWAALWTLQSSLNTKSCGRKQESKASSRKMIAQLIRLNFLQLIA